MKMIICKDCGQDFPIKEEEITWYQSKGFEVPKRCKTCRDKRKQNGASRLS